MRDSFGREINYLRISVTDRCNLRCAYCMPMNGLTFVPNSDLLTAKELEQVVGAAVDVGFNKVRLTGGEPTLRRDIVEIVHLLANVPGIDHSLQPKNSASNGIESKQSATATVGDDTRSPVTPPPNLKDTQQFLLPTFALDCEVPELGDIESMSADQLRVALAERDCLVSTLIGRVRHLNDAHERSVSPEELGALGDEMPEELQQRVSETLNRMNEQLRLSELEMSLERARLSREKVQVEQSQQSLDRQARQMGLERREDGTYVVDRSNLGQKQPRRWLGRLGIGE